MDGDGQREFGRRRAASLSTSRMALRSSAGHSLAQWFAAEPPNAAGPDSVVPTKLLPILQAAVAMLIVQLLLSFLVLGRPPTSPLRVPSLGSNTFTDFILPGLLEMCWNAAHFAAIYTMLAHATLRWIGLSSPKAYALGGLGAAYVLMAVNVLQGAHLTLSETIIELAGGLVAGYLYRLTAGKAPRAQA
jgi:hypothetical protein